MIIDQNLIEFVCCLVGDQEAFQYAQMQQFVKASTSKGNQSQCQRQKESTKMFFLLRYTHYFPNIFSFLGSMSFLCVKDELLTNG
jgi:hypothetical protein